MRFHLCSLLLALKEPSVKGKCPFRLDVRLDGIGCLTEIGSWLGEHVTGSTHVSLICIMLYSETATLCM
jgi:hypothetical protein